MDMVDAKGNLITQELFRIYRDDLEWSLKRNGVDVHALNEKNADFYQKIKSKNITLNFDKFNSIISIEKAIIHYLLTKKTMESKYYTGNAYQLQESECTAEEVETEIITIFHSVTEDITDILTLNPGNWVEEDIVRIITREDDGLRARLKEYLNFDLKGFNQEDKQYKVEICKILYFFYMLEKIAPFNIKIFDIFKKASMENLVHSDVKTENGKWVHLVKETLARDLKRSVVEDIEEQIREIMFSWNRLLEQVFTLIWLVHHNPDSYDNFDDKFQKTLDQLLDNPSEPETKSVPQYTRPPIETLYLKIRQQEMLGHTMDRYRLTKIWQKSKFNVPPELAEEMKAFHDEKIDINTVEEYINNNANELAKYVYLELQSKESKNIPHKEKARKIRYHKSKVPELLKLCLNIQLRPPTREERNVIFTKLYVICCLQAVLIDDKSEILDYDFYGDSTSHRVQAQLKNNGKNKGDMMPIMEMRWYHKIIGHWYVNTGNYDIIDKILNFNCACYEVLTEILKEANLKEMWGTHQFYMFKINQVGMVEIRDTESGQQLW